jgi:proteic killer suppression protein
MLDNARRPEDMYTPGWRLHPLRANLKSRWEVMVSGNWRLTLLLQDEDAILVDCQDHH